MRHHAVVKIHLSAAVSHLQPRPERIDLTRHQMLLKTALPELAPEHQNTISAGPRDQGRSAEKCSPQSPIRLRAATSHIRVSIVQVPELISFLCSQARPGDHRDKNDISMTFASAVSQESCVQLTSLKSKKQLQHPSIRIAREICRRGNNEEPEALLR